MAGEWIKMRTNLWDDPRVSSLCDATGQSEAAVIGALYWLWAAADGHSEDGVMPGLSPAGVDRKTGVRGIGAALISIGWMADHPEGVQIIRFEEHNGKSAKRRCGESRRKVSARHADEKRTPCGRSAHLELELEKKNKNLKPYSVVTMGDEKIAPAKPPPLKRSAQIDPEFRPGEKGISYAEKRGISLEIEVESFKNWHLAKGSVMKDWEAAWRTWCDKAVEYGRCGNPAARVRAGPAQTRADERKQVGDILTGRVKNDHGSSASGTIDGTAARVT